MQDWVAIEPSEANEHIEVILRNLGDVPGLPIASPDVESPNYRFHWIRDGAFSAAALIDELPRSPSLRSTITDYIEASVSTQKVPNLSGGLGEPKFLPDGGAFNEPWGRPQNDGPAIRAMALCKYVHDQCSYSDACDIYTRCIKPDLQFVATHWQDPCFDLWEEVYGRHFFTTAMQYGALKAGKLIAAYTGDYFEANYFADELKNITKDIKSSWLGVQPWSEHIPRNLGNRAGLDVASVLAAVELEHLVNWTTEFDNEKLIVTTRHRMIQALVTTLTTDFALRFPINSGRTGGIGRYPEDMYDGVARNGGNPWFICTAVVAEALIRSGQYDRAVPLLMFIGRHRGPTVSEQADRWTGFMRGASRLSWSHSSIYRVCRTAELVGRPDLADLTSRQAYYDVPVLSLWQKLLCRIKGQY